VTSLVDKQLSIEEFDRLTDLFKQILNGNMDNEGDRFFRSLAYELTGELKELAQLIIDFRREINSKIHPNITDLTSKFLPQTSDQLKAIIEATEMAANKIMDNLENMQEETEKAKDILTSLRHGRTEVRGEGGEKIEIAVNKETVGEISPLLDYMESTAGTFLSLISDSIVQMSFQDLTGQRVKRVMELVGKMEERLKNMILSFGIKLTEKEKNPRMSDEELDRVVEKKVTELAGPQREGEGLDQADIDKILARI
ncbi:MAG: protein phosphatase CheZ, partial [Deltaproteobacteria bacterium]|nr:protein phosphatase CheZ [Deltaproteobacteria bacterium]